MNPHAALRLTPSNSPFFKSPSPRSPTKGSKSEEAGLRLRKVIGTTAASSNGFDCVSSTRQFAYTAGAAAVVATVRDDLTVTQRFFRARPSIGGVAREATQWFLSPSTPNESRPRTFGLVKDSGAAGSPVGTPGRDWLDSPTNKSSTAKDRVKAAASVALSPNGKWIALGETGYRPRVLLFSNNEDSSELPVMALAEHTFGVRALAFSPDSRYLASLGNVNDGFLYIWSIDDRTGAATLHSSNKCTATINAMTWFGRSLLMVGLRFVKVWRPDEEASSNLSAPARATETSKTTYQKQKVLSGKNCLLGDLLEANFTTATPFAADKAIVCTESGEVCLLNDTAGLQFLRAVQKVGFAITAAAVDWNGSLRVAGPIGFRRVFESTDLSGTIPPSPKRRQTQMVVRGVGPEPTVATAMATIDRISVELDSHRAIRLTQADGDDDSETTSHQLPAHNDAVVGVKPYTCTLFPAAAFLTFSTKGSIRFWDADGWACAHFSIPVETSPEMFDMNNELRAVAVLDEGAHLAAGDRYGTLSILDVATGATATKVRAHSAEIVDLVAFERAGAQLLASGSRDRMIQLFHWRHGRLDLLQTMDEHAGAVNGLLIASGGDMLLSCSADRTIVVREAMLRADGDPSSVAFIILRTISLKSSPLSMCLEASDEELLVSTMDRFVGKYHLRTGQAGFSFKCSDAEGGEATILGKVLYAPSLNGTPTIVGVSSSDKSVRLYSEYGSLVARDWGHTEGITDVMLISSGNDTADDWNTPRPRSRSSSRPSQLITVAADSTIFIWDTTSPSASSSASASSQIDELNALPELPAPKIVAPMAPPLRKVLSYSELSRYRARERSLEDMADSPSPTITPAPSTSPPRAFVKKKSSRSSLAQPPKLEPAFRTNSFGPDNSSGRRSLRKRSPSPPSPRYNTRSSTHYHPSRRPSLGNALRSKSSDNMLLSSSSSGLIHTNSAPPPPVPPLTHPAMLGASQSQPTSASAFGSLTSSTESVCRTLRAYRKKLSNNSPSDSSSNTTSSTSNLPSDAALRELEKELKLTARLVGEKAQGKTQLDEKAMAKLLDRASDRIVEMLDDRLRERVDGEFGARRSANTNSNVNGGANSGSEDTTPVADKIVVDSLVGKDERVKLLTGALAEVRLGV